MTTAASIAQTLDEVALLLELRGENIFKVKAHQNAARLLKEYQGGVAGFLAGARAGEIPGIGPQLLKKIEQLNQGGELKGLEELRAEFPRTVLELLRIPGLGPKKVRIIFSQLGIKDITALESACLAGTLAGMKGFGKKTQARILTGIKSYRCFAGCFRFAEALAEAQALQQWLQERGFKKNQLAGALRRSVEVVKNAELVLAGNLPDLAAALREKPGLSALGGEGSTLSFLTSSGLPVSIHVTRPEDFEAQLLWRTGSASHLTELVARARALDLELGPQGLTSQSPQPFSEAQIYERLGLAFIPAAVREGAGEVSIIERDAGAFSSLIKDSDIKGVLHAHSTYSDGRATLREMALAVRQAGYQYLGITDHSASASYAGGLHPEDIRRQHEEIALLNEELAPFRIFKGIESDIRADGSLDYEPDVLNSFDFVIASVHSHFNLSAAEMTARLLKAIRHPATSILGHWTGRLLLERDGYHFDTGAVLRTAAEEGVMIELNANPFRLDIDWRHIRAARELDIKIPICPDAHGVDGIKDMAYGVGIARKGWLRPSDVPNCWETQRIEAFFNCRRRR